MLIHTSIDASVTEMSAGSRFIYLVKAHMSNGFILICFLMSDYWHYIYSCRNRSCSRLKGSTIVVGVVVVVVAVIEDIVLYINKYHIWLIHYGERNT